MKKTLALALTAAMAISAIGASVSAATVEVKKDVEAWEQTATVKLAKEDISGGKVLTGADAVKNTKLGKLASNNIAKFVGWTLTSQTGYSATNATAPYDENTTVAKLVSDGVLSAAEGQREKTLYPVFRYYTSEKERTDTLNGDGDVNSAKNREDVLKELDKANNATDNAKDPDNAGKVKTLAATVTPDNENPDKPNPEKDPFGGNDREHFSKMVEKAYGVKDENALIYVYDVQAPAGLLAGKNARATLPVATTVGFKVNVYHVVDAYKLVKVTGVDTGTKDVSFWASSFSPYIAVLTPRDSTVAGTSTGNPGTGDFSAVPVALLAAAALGATGFVAYKKRKAE